MWRLLSDKIEEISVISLVEYAFFLAALETRLEPDKFSCFRCCAKYKEKFKEAKRKSKGCYDYSTRVFQIENIVYKTCIGNYNSKIDFLLEAFNLYEKGKLPFEGTLEKQPNKIIEIFGVIEQRMTEKRKDKK